MIQITSLQLIQEKIMNKCLCILLFYLLSIISCETNKVKHDQNCLEYARGDIDDETRYYLMQMVDSHERTRLFLQSRMKEIKDLEGTFWIKEIPKANLYSFEKCFAFFDNKILIIETNAEIAIPELSVTSAQRYKFTIYKIEQCIEFDVVDSKELLTRQYIFKLKRHIVLPDL